MKCSSYASKSECRKLLEALELGPISTRGGGVFDIRMKYVCSRWEVVEILKQLKILGIHVDTKGMLW